MKAVIINSTDIGGTGLAGRTLCQALNTYTGFDTKVLCGGKESSDELVTQVLSGKILRLHNIFKRLLPSIHIEHFPHVSHKILKWVKDKKPDIINLHNIHGGYFPYPIISKLGRIAPIVVSMQDMWCLTGHCAYSYDCDKWQSGCFVCPHKDWYEPLGFRSAHFHWRRKKRIFENEKIVFVTCSKWIQNKAQKSLIMAGKTIHQIFNPIDTDTLKPISQDAARNVLNLPKGKNIIAYGAANISDPRKGFKELLRSMSASFVSNNNLFLLTMGQDRNGTLKHVPHSLPHLHVKDGSSDLVRSIVYNAADVFVFPTKADNVPNMLAESLSCGRPAITFDVGGCGEIIINNKTGYLAKYADYTDFQHGIELLLHNTQQRGMMEQQCRLFAVSNFSMESCAEKYATVFQELLQAIS